MSLQQICKTKINNSMNAEKTKYVLEMRKELCHEHIIHEDGSLNIKYFNVKKGQYWSNVENELLIEGVIKHGATAYKAIKEDYLKETKDDQKGVDWSETEIRLRICRLLRYYNLEDYKTTKFHTREDIAKEAAKNKAYAQELKAEGDSKSLVGGIYYNPPVNAAEAHGESFFYSYFNAKQ